MCLLHCLGETVGRPYMQLDNKSWSSLGRPPSRSEGDPAFFHNFLRFLAHPKAELRASPSQTLSVGPWWTVTSQEEPPRGSHQCLELNRLERAEDQSCEDVYASPAFPSHCCVPFRLRYLE